MLPSALIVSVQSAEIDLLELFLYVVPVHFESSPIHRRQCAHVDIHRAGFTFLCAAQNMAMVETWCFIAALPNVNFQCHGTSLRYYGR
jgi:hypothetical protein